MDAQRFDALSRALSEAGSRRGLLGRLATLPVLGSLLALLDPEESAARGRRHRRRVKSHKHGKGRRRKHHKKCQPNSKSTTCAGGKCGPVINNCKKTVDCGSCDCPAPCDTCFICQSGPNTPGACVPDPEQDGDACDDGDLCTTDSTCSDGVCGGGSPTVCPANDCQVPGVCDPDSGNCTSPGFKPVGTPCASQPCGECNGGGVCVANAACSGTEPICDVGTCAACTADPESCPGSTCCDAGTGECVGTCPASTPICVDRVCTACSDTNPCATGCCDVVTGACVATGQACGTAGTCLSNGTCITACSSGPSAACPLGASACTGATCSGSTCCSVGIGGGDYCSPGGSSSIPCTGSALADCPRGLFCRGNNTCVPACVG